MILAEGFADNINWTLIATMGMAVFTALMWWDARKQRTVSATIESQPVGVQKIYPSATMRDLDEKCKEQNRRLDDHDRQLLLIWTTMRDEHKDIRKELSENLKSINLALGRIQGALETLNEK